MMYKDLYEWLRIRRQMESENIRIISEYARKCNCLPFTAALEAGNVSYDDISLAVSDIYQISAVKQDFDLTKVEVLDMDPDIYEKLHFVVCRSDPPKGKTGEWARVYLCNPADKLLIRQAVAEFSSNLQLAYRWIPEATFTKWKESGANKRGNATAMSKMVSSMKKVEAMEHKVSDINADLGDPEANQVRDVVNEIIMYAVKTGSSDIHIRPTQTGGEIAYRIDGMLVPTQTIDDVSQYLRIMGRIKVMSDGINENLDRIPQDGKIAFTTNDLRVSTIPTIYGESCVIRVLNSGADKIRTLTELGYTQEAADQLHRIYTKPHGIMLVSGPTGSGKSSTLAAVTTDVMDDGVCLITIEEPVEYRITGAVQSNVSNEKGNTFEGVLKAALRHDPDIIMIGEIRDTVTAKTAIQASNTGHLVFSTIHTNDAASVISRLEAMGVEKYLISDNLIGIVSQSLLRRLCPQCKEEHVITKDDIKEWLLPDTMYQKKVFVPHPGGCPACSGKGYKGRTCVYEIMEITEAIKDALHNNATNAELEQVARDDADFVSKLDFSYKLVLDGVTAFPEVKRAIGGLSVSEVKRGLKRIEEREAQQTAANA